MGKFYQDSQFLPVLANLNPDDFWNILPEITVLSAQFPDPSTNIAEALRYIPTRNSDKLPAQYLLHEGVGVALRSAGIY